MTILWKTIIQYYTLYIYISYIIYHYITTKVHICRKPQYSTLSEADPFVIKIKGLSAATTTPKARITSDDWVRCQTVRCSNPVETTDPPWSIVTHLECQEPSTWPNMSYICHFFGWKIISKTTMRRRCIAMSKRSKRPCRDWWRRSKPWRPRHVPLPLDTHGTSCGIPVVYHYFPIMFPSKT